MFLFRTFTCCAYVRRSEKLEEIVKQIKRRLIYQPAIPPSCPEQASKNLTHPLSSTMSPPPLTHDGSALTTTLRGVLFRCTIRGGHATLAIVPSSNESESDSNKSDGEESNNVVIIVVQLGGNQWKKTHQDDGTAAGCDPKTTENGRSGDFANSISQMRSNIRRMCKLGNELEFIGNFANDASPDASPDTKEPSDNSSDNRRDWNAYQRRKFIVDYDLQLCQDNIKVTQVSKWDATKCQMLRSKFFDGTTTKPKKQQPPTKKKRRNDNNNDDRSDDNKQEHHYQAHATAKGKTKRIQGEVLADFVLWMLSTIHHNTDDTDNDIMKQSAAVESANETIKEEQIYEEIGLKKKLLPTDQKYLFIERWRALHSSLSSSSQESSSEVQARNESVAEKLRKCSTGIISSSSSSSSKNNNNNSQKDDADCQQHHLGGILDAAGGAGHVSLALSLRGIHSTIVDPRPAIGKLPGRDRKVLKKSKSKVPFSTYRAWFGSKPEGVDTLYREGRLSLETFLPDSERSSNNDGQHQLPICSMASDDKLLPNCAAIVALHPDEATGVIVQTAVENKIPFCVVPCCVFSRLFPERINPGGKGGVVSTYYELIDWLVDLHPEIRVTTLPFEGANFAVWAIFQ
jgi:hypothetical protein